jgi:hypothetical protein
MNLQLFQCCLLNSFLQPSLTYRPSRNTMIQRRNFCSCSPVQHHSIKHVLAFLDTGKPSCLYATSTSYFPSHPCSHKSRGRSVGTATGHGLDDRGPEFEFVKGKDFFFSMSSRPALGRTQPPIQSVPGTLSPEVKLPGREADHSPPTSAEVKQRASIHPLSHTSSWRSA